MESLSLRQTKRKKRSNRVLKRTGLSEKEKKREKRKNVEVVCFKKAGKTETTRDGKTQGGLHSEEGVPW